MHGVHAGYGDSPHPGQSVQCRLCLRVALLSLCAVALAIGLCVRLLLLLLRGRLLLRPGLLHRVGLEGQHAAEMARDTAELAAQSGLSEHAADCATQRLADLADQIAEEALWRHLLLLLLLDLLLKLLLDLLQLLLQLLNLLQLLQRVLLALLALLAIRLLHGISREGQHATKLAGDITDLSAQA